MIWTLQLEEFYFIFQFRLYLINIYHSCCCKEEMNKKCWNHVINFTWWSFVDIILVGICINKNIVCWGLLYTCEIRGCISQNTHCVLWNVITHFCAFHIDIRNYKKNQKKNHKGITFDDIFFILILITMHVPMNIFLGLQFFEINFLESLLF